MAYRYNTRMLVLPSYDYADYSENARVSYGGHGNSGCCSLVVDPKAYIALLAFIGAATYFFQELIGKSKLARKKRSLHNSIFEGKTQYVMFVCLFVRLFVFLFVCLSCTFI